MSTGRKYSASGERHPAWPASPRPWTASLGRPACSRCTCSTSARTPVVTGTDKAGNTTVVTIGFTVTTSYDDVATLLDRFEADHRITRAAKGFLSTHLDLARRHASRARHLQAEDALNRFIHHVEHDVSDQAVAQVLVRDANILIRELRRGPGR